MPFLGYPVGGATSIVMATNPYLLPSSCRSHIILAHPTEVNGLILTRGEGEPYSKSTEGFLKGDGRSIAGSLKVNGNQWKKDSSTCNFVMSLDMADQFRRMLTIQETSEIPITIIDNWVTGRRSVGTGTLTIGDKKWETSKPGRQFLIQFAIEWD